MALNQEHYGLKHNAIQARTNRMGFFVLFTNTRMSAEDILRIYRQKDVVEKAFITDRIMSCSLLNS